MAHLFLHYAMAWELWSFDFLSVWSLLGNALFSFSLVVHIPKKSLILEDSL